jgi:hypothetical protein
VTPGEGDVMSLGSASDAPAPPPAAGLMAAIEGMKPVRTRVPGKSAAVLGAVLAAIPVGALSYFGPRQDLGALPVAWVIVMAVLWTAALALALLSATLPPRGEVLPDTAKARRTTIVVAVALLLLGLLATVDVPGRTIVPETTLAAFGHWWWHCTVFALEAVVPVLVVGGLLLRRLFPIGGRWAGAAVGAAGGAAAGLTLHFICPIGGGLHVGFAHAGGVLLGGLLGGLILSRPLGASAPPTTVA